MTNTDTSELLRNSEESVRIADEHARRMDMLKARGLAATYGDACTAVLLKEIENLRARTSQAEAQAPTTAASVLTELAPAFKTTSWLSSYLNTGAGLPESNDANLTMGEARDVLVALLTMRDRLTGAPAPAPTTDPIIEIVRMSERLGLYDTPAKGDTPAPDTRSAFERTYDDNARRRGQYDEGDTP